MNEDTRRRLQALIQASTNNIPGLEQELLGKMEQTEAPGSFKRIMPESGFVELRVPLLEHMESLSAEHRIAPERVMHLGAGARPVMRILDNKVTGAFIGPASEAWAGIIEKAQEQINGVIPAVGRIELVNGDIPWAGTGWMIAGGIVVTNRHVANEFSRRDRASGKFVFLPGLSSGQVSSDIDFLEEENRLDTDEHPVTSVLWVAGPDDPDVAFLRVTQAGGKPALPPPIPLADGAAEQMVVAAIGYPARDPSIRDQQLVLSIFGDVYEKKRLAPGKVLSVGDTLLTHDCSTLGGNSGSVLIDLNTGKAVGLHQGGYLDDTANVAVPAAQLRRLLDQALRQEAARTSEKPAGPTPTAPEAAATAPESSAGAGGTVTLKFQLPIEITVKVGEPVPWAANAPRSAGQAAGAPLAGDVMAGALQAARAQFGSLPDVLDIHAGYRFKNGWITDERVVVVEVREKLAYGDLAAAGRPPFPREILGVGIDVRTAALPDQLDIAGLGDIVVERAARPAGYQEPPGYKDPDSGMALARVNERMKAIFHVSPDSGFPNLKAFFGRVKQHLTATMYEWTPTHISDAIEAAMQPAGNTLRMVTQKNGVGNTDATESAVADMYRRIGNKFAHVWASVRGPHRLIQSSYHIKVASRDGEEFWLSSGNWKDSNQPDSDPAGTHSTDPALLLKNNREWHVIIKHAGLATLFQKYIEYDFQEATRVALLGQEGVAMPAAEFFVPVDAFRLQAESPNWVEYVEPLELDQVLDVEPLLTPDCNAEGKRLFILAATEMLRRATRSIYVQNQSFSLTEDDNEEIETFFTVLKQKQQEIDDVRVIFRDAREYGRRADLVRQQKLIEYLKEFGLKVSPDAMRLQVGCHTKGIIIDSREVMLGSQNITGQGALFNRDASLLVRSPEVARYFEKRFLFDWDHLAHNEADEQVGGARRAAPGEETPAGFRRVSLSEILGDD